MGNAFRNALDDIVTFLPKLLAFIVILAVGYLIAKLLEKGLVKLLQKVGFDRLVERGGIKKALASSSYDAAQILAKIVFYALLVFVVSTAFGVFGPNPISDYLSAVIGYLPKIFVAILILVIAAAIAAGVKMLVQSALGGLPYGKVLANVASVLIIALGVIAALNQLEIARNVVNAVLYASLAALVGVVVVAVGGGGIAPMRQRWENALAKVEDEAPNMRREVRNAQPPAQAVRQEAQRYSGSGQQQDGEPPAGATAAGHAQSQQQGGQQPFYGQPGQYDQPTQFGQPGRYGPPTQYGQPGQYGQPAHYAQPDQYSQPGQYGAPEQPYDQADPPQAPHYGHGQQYGQQQYSQEAQYGQPRQPHGQDQQGGHAQQSYDQSPPPGTGSVPVPDPQQAYEQPVQRVEDDDPGTRELPRATDDDRGQQG